MDRRLWAGLACMVWLAACDGGASAVTPAREHAPMTAAPAVPAQSASVQAPAVDPRDAPVPQVDGKPMWSANRRYTAQENAQRHFERNGEAFGAATVDAYVQKAHAFVSRPPAGAETVKRRNGDTLIYDPDANIFAVATRQGAPRTMFKPDDGAAYWERQKAEVSQQASRPGGDDRG